jgi:hypothetical protein
MSDRDAPDAWWGDESPIGVDRRRERGAPPDADPFAAAASIPDPGPVAPAPSIPDPGPLGDAPGHAPAWDDPGSDRDHAARPAPRRGPPVVEPGPPSSAPRQMFVPPPEELPPFEDELVGAAVAPPLQLDDPIPAAPALIPDPAGPPAPGPVPGRPPRPARIDRKRLRVVYDIDGPRVRLGVGWFLAAVVAAALGPFTTAIVFAVAAGLAGRQIVRAWGSVAWQADVAAGIAAVPVLAAGVAGMPGAVATAVLGAIVAVGAACAPDGARLPGSGGRVAAAGIMLLALVPALGAVCVVLVAAHAIIAAVVLIVVASAYEVGDYIVGSGSSNPIEGPLAGITTATLVALPLALVLVEPYDTGGIALLVFTAAACPFGQILASAALPGAGAHAPALRRIDTLLLLAVIWAAAAAAF